MISTIILSDLHLGSTNIHHERLAVFLEIIATFDRVILNGDFLDDLWEYKDTLESDWSPLIHLLREKEVIYIFGNHDPETPKLLEATSDFISEYHHMYHLPVADKELVIMHGQSIYPRPVDRLYLERKTWHGKLFNRFVRVLWYSFYPIILTIRFFIEKSPGRLAKIQRKIIRVQNDKMREYAKEKLEPYQILVCGHSHLAEFSPELQFINEGANSYERVEYLSIRDEKMELVIRKI